MRHLGMSCPKLSDKEHLTRLQLQNKELTERLLKIQAGITETLRKPERS
jgi:hypothetical protein